MPSWFERMLEEASAWASGLKRQKKYGDGFECYCRVKPGLTGIWQVSGRSELSYDARVALDCTYVERWSLTQDLIILLKTFSVVVNQDGAF